MSGHPPEDNVPSHVIQQGGVAVGPDGSATVAGDIVGRDKIVNIALSREDARIRRDQLILLNKVKMFWVKSVLEKSVHSEALIELGKQTQADTVERERPWDMTLEISEQESRAIPPGKKICEIFDGMEHALLILGAPGSGKTITLLELARDLIARAEQDHTHPIPVVFNLSSWAERKPLLAEWLADEMSLKYQIPRKIGRKWLTDNAILPLLDGLDEVRAESRTACVEAINTYWQEYSLAGVAVCSRTESYRALTARLKLAGAIQLQPLTDEQVKEYVGSFGTKLAGLYKALRQDPILRELSQSPLMLGVMGLAYADVSLEDVLQGGLETIEAHRKHLFDTYIERMFKRKSSDKRLSREQTMWWLSWLAQGMKRHKQSIFLIEGLQPSWLPKRILRWEYAFISRLLAGLAIGLALTAINSALLSPLLESLQHGILFGLIGSGLVGLIASWRFDLTRKDTFSESPSKSGHSSSRLNALIIGSLILFQSCALSYFLVPIGAWHLLFIDVFMSGPTFGIIFGLRGIGRKATNDIQTVEALAWSWLAAIRGGVLGTIYALVGGGIVGLIIGLTIAVFLVLIVLAFVFLAGAMVLTLLQQILGPLPPELISWLRNFVVELPNYMREFAIRSLKEPTVIALLLLLQRDFTLLRDFMYYYETLPLRRVEGRLSNRERVRLR